MTGPTDPPCPECGARSMSSLQEPVLIKGGSAAVPPYWLLALVRRCPCGETTLLKLLPDPDEPPTPEVS